ncbi:MAG TPA: C1 domain-containing protein [Polyangiaceae bacterium]|jgi:hypothetical protein
MTRRNALVTAFAILGTGIVVTAGTYAAAAPGGTYVIASGAVVVGLYRLAVALAMPKDAAAHAVDLDDPRWRDSALVQVAGKRCAACDKRILGEADGAVCKRCDAIVHRACLRAHRSGHAAKVRRAS